MLESHGVDLQVSALWKRYGFSSVGIGLEDPIDFQIPAGKFFTLLGPSGCGKTTTLRCVAGLEQPNGGLIRAGNDTYFDSAKNVLVPLNRRNIGIVFQSYAIWPHMTVFDNVAFPLNVEKKLDRDIIARRVNEALEIVDLAKIGTRLATELSGGQQQRVALARAIIRKPSILLLDEPLSNLDAKLRAGMRRELKQLQRVTGLTTIYVTHDQTEALEMSDVIAILDRGAIMQVGTPHDLFHNPRNCFVADFLGATNMWQGSVTGAVARNDFAPIVLADGRVLTAQFPNAVASNEPVALTVRPETIALCRAGQAPTNDRLNQLQGIVRSVGFLGHTARYVVESGPLMVEVLCAAEPSFAVSDPVTLAFPFVESKGLPLTSSLPSSLGMEPKK